ITIGVGRDAQRQVEARMVVDDFYRRRPGRQQPDRVAAQPLDLDPKPGAVGDDEAEVAGLRAVYARIVDLIDDAEAEREPDPRPAEAAADEVLGTAGPGGVDAGLAGRYAVRFGLVFSHERASSRPTAEARRRTRFGCCRAWHL